MFDVKVVVVGVAGLFVALGVAAAIMLGFGHIASALGQSTGSGPVAQAGSYLSGIGMDVIVFLTILAALVVFGFLYFILRK